MPATDQIELNREAGELREEARQEQKNLEQQIMRQVNGELDEDESQLTATEIKERREAIEEKLSTAKEIEGVDDLDQFAAENPDAVDNEVKSLLFQLANQPQDEKQGVEDLEVFGSVGEFLRAVRKSTNPDYDGHELTRAQAEKLRDLRQGATKFEQGERFQETDEKELFNLDEMDADEIQELFEAKTLQGDTSGSGQALVPNVHMTELLRAMGEEQQFVQRARHVPMQRRTIDFPRLVQDDAADTRPIYGFAAVSKIGEGAQKPEREPGFEQFQLSSVKYAAYLEASDELLQESIVDAEPVLTELLTDAIAYEYDRDAIRGSGSSEPQGFIGSNAEYLVNRDNQNQIQTGDVFTMESRFFGSEGIYMFHPSAIPQLADLSSSNIIVWNQNLETEMPGTLMGRPMVRTHKLPQLGAKGDLCLVDPEFYIAGDMQQITISNSIHYQFRNDVTAWRAVFRAAGSPWPAGTFSHESDGSSKSYEVSPFVVLGGAVAS